MLAFHKMLCQNPASLNMLSLRGLPVLIPLVGAMIHLPTGHEEATSVCNYIRIDCMKRYGLRDISSCHDR